MKIVLIQMLLVLWNSNKAVFFLLPIISFISTLVNANELDNQSLYGEVAVLKEYEIPEMRTGHDAFRPLSDQLTPYFDFKKQLSQGYGLSYIFEYSPQLQWDIGSNETHHANDETNIIIQWSPLEHTDSKKGNLTAWYQISRTLGSTHTSKFMEELGIITPTNGGDTSPGDSGTLIQMLAWEQWFLDDKLRASAGKLTTRTFLNLNRYATSDREDFFTPMHVNNPVAPFTARNGLGVFAQYLWSDFYLTGMLREADGTSQGVSFDTIGSGKWESAFELGLTPSNLLGLGKGYYRFTTYYTDSIGEGDNYQPSGWSAAMSFDQDVGDSYGMFMRYAYSDKPFRAFKQRLSIGMQIKNPLRFEYDRIGLGAWWGDPISVSENGEYGVEGFWKFQLSPYFEFTPDLQIILNPQGNTDKSMEFVGGLRIRLVF